MQVDTSTVSNSFFLRHRRESNQIRSSLTAPLTLAEVPSLGMLTKALLIAGWERGSEIRPDKTAADARAN